MLLAGSAVAMLCCATLIQFVVSRYQGVMPRLRVQALLIRRLNLVIVLLAVFCLGLAILYSRG